MSSTIVELNKQFIEETALEALEGLSLFLGSDPEVIDSMSPEEVREELGELEASASGNKLEEMMELIRKKAFGDSNDLDVEKNIVVRMPPIKRQKVKLRVKNLGPAELRVVYDPLPDE